MKKLTVLLITILSVYLIYNMFNKKQVNYISISDSVINNYNYYINKSKLIKKFNNYFTSSTIKKAYQDIQNNRTIRINDKDYYIKKELRESDILVISIGMEELSKYYNKFDINNNYNYFNKMYADIVKLISEVKKYTYGKIVFIGYYNPTNYYDANTDRFFYDMDIKFNRLMLDNNIIYIDLYEMIKGNNYKENNSIYLNNLGNKRIASVIEYYLS